MIKQYLHKKLMEKNFGKYISPELLDAIDLDEDVDKLKEDDLDVFITMVGGNSPQEISSRIGSISEIIVEQNAFLDTMVSSILVFLYAPTRFDARKGDPEQLLTALMTKFGNNIKIVRIRGKGYIGNLGGPKRYSFSFLLPQFSKAMAAIHDLPFGSIKEINITEPDGSVDQGHSGPVEK